MRALMAHALREIYGRHPDVERMTRDTFYTCYWKENLQKNCNYTTNVLVKPHWILAQRASIFLPLVSYTECMVYDLLIIRNAFLMISICIPDDQ